MLLVSPMMHAEYSFLLLVCSILLLSDAEGCVFGRFWPSCKVPWTRSSKLEDRNETIDTTSGAARGSNQWTSLFTVDPAQIFSTLAKHGGFLIPKEYEKDIKVLNQVVSFDKTELNFFDRELILHNVTIGIPWRRRKSLRVGRVYVHWESYFHPCMNIEVDDVDILVEFTNVLMTRNNWNELVDFGFPPHFESQEGNQGSDTESPFRFNSVDLSGNMTITVRSRPLKKELGRLDLNLDETDDFNVILRKASHANRRKGQAGCTLDEVIDLLQNYIGDKVRRIVAFELEHMTTSGLDRVDRGLTDHVLTHARNMALDYKKDVERQTLIEVRKAVSSRLEKWMQRDSKPKPPDN